MSPLSIVSGEPSVEEFKPGAGEGEAREEDDDDDESRNSRETVRTSDERQSEWDGGTSNSSLLLFTFLFSFFK